MADNANFERNSAVLSMLTKAELVQHVDALFRQEGSAKRLGIDPSRLHAFAKAVGRHYHENPYHNFHHAVDTVNTLVWMIDRPVLKAHLPTAHRFLLMLSALVHDVEHPGHNNQWEVQTGSALARRYDNVAVLENHSFAVAQALMGESEADLFADLDPDTAEQWWAIVKELVLATDFSMHRHFLDGFATHLSEEGVEFGQPVGLSWIARALIKSADIANTAKPFAEAKVWGQRVMLEFWCQGVEEKRGNLIVGPLNDPDNVRLNAAQAGFIKFAAMELFELMAQVEPEFREMLDNLRDNLLVYEDMARHDDGLFE